MLEVQAFARALLTWKLVRLDRSTSQLSIEGATRIQNLLDLLQLVATRFGEPQWFTLQAGPLLTGMLTSGMESRRLGVSNQKGREYVRDSMMSRRLGAASWNVCERMHKGTGDVP